MGISLPNALLLQLADKVIRSAALLDFDFVSGRKRYWVGKGDLVAGGYTWTGVDTILSLDLGQYSINGAAEQFSLSLAGVSEEFLQKVREGAGDVLGRRLRIYVQTLDEDFQPVDEPFLVRTGRMRGLPHEATGVSTWTITLECESIFAARGRPPATYLNTVEQQRRHGPNAKGLEYLPSLQNRTVTWPK